MGGDQTGPSQGERDERRPPSVNWMTMRPVPHLRGGFSRE